MNRFLTVFTLCLAAGAVATAISLRACRSKPVSQEGLALDLMPSEVRKITLHSGTQQVDLQREGGVWQLQLDKTHDAANPTLIAKILELASQLIAYDHIPSSEIPNSKALNHYGVRSPKRWIEFTANSEPVRLLFGKDAAFDGRLYARISGTRDVLVIDDALAQMVEQEADSFRDSVLTRYDPEQVDSFVIRGQRGMETALERDVSGWKIVKPLSAPADPEVVQKFLISLLHAPLEGVVGNSSGDLGFFGIEEGVFEVSFHVEGRELPLALRFGYTPGTHPGTILAQFTGRNLIARLPAQARELLNVTPETFRDRRLLPINPDIVDFIRIADHATGKNLEIRRSSDGWILAGSGAPASAAAIHRLFDTLATLRVSEFSPQESADAVRSIEFFSYLSENTPEATAGESPVAKLTLGKPREGQVEAKLDNTPGSLKVPDSLFALISADPDPWQLPTENTEATDNPQPSAPAP